MNLVKYKSRVCIFQIRFFGFFVLFFFKFLLVIQKVAANYLLTTGRYVKNTTCF